MSRFAINTVAYIEADSEEEALKKLFSVIETLGFDLDVNDIRELPTQEETHCIIHEDQRLAKGEFGLMCPTCLKEGAYTEEEFSRWNR